MNKDERPLGDGQTFITAVTLSIITSSLIHRVGADDLIEVSQRWTRTTSLMAKLTDFLQTRRGGMIFISLGLQMSMVVMRVPVMIANAA